MKQRPDLNAYLNPEEIARLQELAADMDALQKVRASLHAEADKIRTRAANRRDRKTIQRRREAERALWSVAQ